MSTAEDRDVDDDVPGAAPEVDVPDATEQESYLLELCIVSVAGEVVLPEFQAESSWTAGFLARQVMEHLPAATLGARLCRFLYDGQVVPSTQRLGEALYGASQTTLVVCAAPGPGAWKQASSAITLSEEGALATLSVRATGPFHIAIAEAFEPGDSGSWEVRFGQSRGAIRSFGVLLAGTFKSNLTHPNHGHYSPDQSISYETSSCRLYMTLLEREFLSDLPLVRQNSVVTFELSEGTLTIFAPFIDDDVAETESNEAAHSEDSSEKAVGRRGDPLEKVAVVDGLEDMVLHPFVCFYEDNVGNQAWIRPAAV